MRIIVDDHATDKHPDVTDDIILDLVRLLDGIEQAPDAAPWREAVQTRLAP